MFRKSDDTRYGTIAIVIHWLVAILILTQFLTGFIASQTTDSSTKADILWFHAPMGNAVLILTILRVIWWWKFDNKPGAIGGNPGWQVLSAKVVHNVCKRSI